MGKSKGALADRRARRAEWRPIKGVAGWEHFLKGQTSGVPRYSQDKKMEPLNAAARIRDAKAKEKKDGTPNPYAGLPSNYEKSRSDKRNAKKMRAGTYDE